MADIADKTQDRMEIEDLLRGRQKAVQALPAPTGECFYCGELVADNDHFCSVDCRRDWDKERKIRQRQGLAK